MSEHDEAVRAYLESQIRPLVQADGGDFVVERVCDGEVGLLIRGQCATCPASEKHLVGWLGERLEAEFGHPFTIHKRVVIPYFWR